MNMSNLEEVRKFTHELKNSLMICQGYLEILEREVSSNYISIIRKEINRSLQMIYNYSNNNLKIERIDLSILLHDVVDTVYLYYLDNKCKITLKVKEELYIEGDYNKLKQVFLNILKNLYEAKATEIIIKVNNKDDNYQIIIEDNGEGIDKDNVKKIGKDSFTTKDNGTGIGLAYCKDIINKLNGSLQIKSIKDKGTKIIIKNKKSEDFSY